tara:strand:+ start:2543 stop:3115 length:573 start_codon:yes stop_codon:yes gene_type:complete
MSTIKPSGAVVVSRKVKRESNGGINRVLRSIIRSEWEGGETAVDLANRHGVTTRTIFRWKTEEKWDRENGGTDHILEYARAAIAKKTEECKMEVHLAIGDIINRQKATSAILSRMLEETLAQATAYPESKPAKQLHTIKIATEIARNIQLMERKAWGLDDEVKKKDNTAIYDILTETTELVALQGDGNSE